MIKRSAIFSLSLFLLVVAVPGVATGTVAQETDGERQLDAQNNSQSTEESAVEAALEMVRNNNIERGVIALQRLGGQGNADALFHLGEFYRLGIGHEKTNDVAAMYYRLASTLGHERASLSLANLLFFDGDGSEKSYGEALGLWQTLALDGDLESIYMLGMIYWNGEAGVAQDPVRGYGLVWRAALEGYKDAEQNEMTMRSLLNNEARETAMAYGNGLDVRGFSSEPLALELVTGSEAETSSDVTQEDITEGETIKGESTEGNAVPASAAENVEPEEDPVEPVSKPEDWSKVWRLEVGFAMSEFELRRLKIVITTKQQSTIAGLHSDIVPSRNRPGLYRLIFGPMKSMPAAVSTCVALKRAGHDCSAKPPE